jgi:hypothetical protein
LAERRKSNLAILNRLAAAGDLGTRGNLQEAIMVDRLEATGWAVSGFAVLATILVVWALGFE